MELTEEQTCFFIIIISDHENIMHPDKESESLMKKHLNLETKAK